MAYCNRREFLMAAATQSAGFLALSSIASLLVQPALALDTKTVLALGDGTHAGGDPFSSIPSRSGRGAILIYGPNDSTRIEVDFLPHGFAKAGERALFAFEKWGTRATICDPVTKKITRHLEAGKGRRFFGHAASGGDKVFASVMDDIRGEGRVVVFNSAGDQTADYTSGGAYPHDCQMDPATGDLIVLNSRSHAAKNAEAIYGKGETSGRSVLVWMNISNGHINRRIDLGNPSGGYAHFRRGPSGEFYFTGSGYTDARHSISLNATMSKDGHTIDLAAGAITPPGESLSVAIDEKGVLAMTYPGANKVLFWSALNRKLIGHQNMKQPRGIFWHRDANAFLVNSAAEKKFYFADAENLRPASMFSKTAGTGSHLMII